MTTDTRLSLMNKALLEIGERRVSSSTESSTAVKALEALKDAFHSIQLLADWSWTRKLLTGIYSVDTVTFNRVFTRVHGVKTKVNNTFRHATFVSSYVYDMYPLVSFSNDLNFVHNYTILDDKIKVRPYPDSPLRQSTVFFDLTVYIPLPSLDTDTLDMPDLFVPLLIRKTAVHLAERILDDVSSVQMHTVAFNQELSLLRSVLSKNSKGQGNMFRRSRATWS